MRTKDRNDLGTEWGNRIAGYIEVADAQDEEEGNAMAGVIIALAASVPFYLALLWICFG